MNSTDYLETVDPSDFFFYEGGKELLEELDHNGSVLLTKAFADEYDLMAGDIVPVLVRYDMSSGNDVYFYSSRFDVVVAGLVKGLPGLAGISVFIYTITGPHIQ